MNELKSVLLLLTLTFAGLALNPQLSREGDRRKTVDLLLVIDTTASMAPAVASLKHSASAMIQGLQQVFPDASLRLGLVNYRDRGESYLTRHCPLVDTAGFPSCVDALQTGGGSGAEAMLSGLQEAAQASWRRRADHQVVVLITDAPGHKTNRQAVNRLVEAERARGRVFHTLQVGQHPQARSQLMRIAELGNGGHSLLDPDVSTLGGSIVRLLQETAP